MRWYLLDLNPVPWRVGPVYASRSKTTHKLGGGVGRDQEVHAYQEAIRAEIAKQSPEMIEGKFKLVIFFWREMTDYRTPQSRRARSHEADSTNMYKATEDALQGILFKNDKDNVAGRAYIVEQKENIYGKVLIGIESVTKDSVMQELQDFVPLNVQDKIWSTEQNKKAGDDWNDLVNDEYNDAPEVF